MLQAILQCQVGYKILIPLIFSIVFLIVWVVKDERKLKKKDQKIKEHQKKLDLTYRLLQAPTNQDKADLKKQFKIILDDSMLGHVAKKKKE
ncbi:MAG: hypothetical protein ACUZ8N_11540 [Candidatus Scalindua sp.]